MDKERVHIYYSGRVQGVGFRFTAVKLADELGISGWVKNLRDGRVEIVAEAQKDALIIFLNRLSGCFSNYISDTEVEWLPAENNFNGFQIKF